MRFQAEHRFPAAPEAVAELLVDPEFHEGLELPDLALLGVVDHRADGAEALLSLRYEYVGHLEPVAQRLVGRAQLTWIQEAVVDRVTGDGRLRFAVEGHRDRLYGGAQFTLRPDVDDTVWALHGEVKVRVPLVGSTAERRILDGVLRRLDIEAQQMTERLLAER